MRKRKIIANWKMNKTCEETHQFIKKLSAEFPKQKSVDIVIAPPFTALGAASVLVDKTEIKLSAQNSHYELSGAYTGEISPLMLNELGCTFCLVGHSERRRLFLETDEMIGKKIRALLKQKVWPILCVGETLGEREQAVTEKIIERQLSVALSGLEAFDIRHLVIAYEPVWAIGTGLTATPAQAQAVHAFIRKWVWDRFNFETANELSIVYGGSVTQENLGTLLNEKDIDGALVGGASLKVDSFSELIQIMEGKN